jgi:hypothetical protein
MLPSINYPQQSRDCLRTDLTVTVPIKYHSLWFGYGSKRFNCEMKSTANDKSIDQFIVCSPTSIQHHVVLYLLYEVRCCSFSYLEAVRQFDT